MMSIETTINLRDRAGERLIEASEKAGHSKSKLVVMLMERVVVPGPKLVKESLISRVEAPYKNLGLMGIQKSGTRKAVYSTSKIQHR